MEIMLPSSIYVYIYKYILCVFNVKIQSETGQDLKKKLK